jgi:PAS domain S-box-containing protein
MSRESDLVSHEHALLDTAPEAMLVADRDGLIDFVNLQAETLLGYAREELVGHSLDMLIPPRYQAAHASHLVKLFQAPVARAMGSGLELFVRKKDGSELPIEVSLRPLTTVRGRFVSTSIRDLTERKRLAAETTLIAQRLASAVESIRDAFALFDAADRLVECNSVYRSLFGDTITGPILGRSYADLAGCFAVASLETPEQRERFVADRLAQRADPKGSYDVRTRDGRRLRVSNRRTPEGGIVKTIWDLTDDLLREEELTSARRAAEQGSAAKTEFLSSMSHELRTPLNAVLGFAQLLQRDKREPLSTRHRERVAQILKGGEHLLHLIDDVLDLSRIEAGNVFLSFEPVSIGTVLNEVRETLESMAARLGIHLEVEGEGGASVVLTTDRTRFAQILMNFGSNAIKYNRPEGAVTFRVSESDHEGRARVSVIDTGLGIPAGRQPRLFEPFQRAGQENGPIEGTGIGLAISRRLAGMMNGAVGFSSVLGEGSTFWVDLPLQSASSPSAAAPAVRRPPSARPEGARRFLVLYVEDNPANIAFLADVLGSLEGFDLISAPNAEIGIELARSRRPDVGIFDINLPGMSGIDALRVLRASPETRAIPVIALTAAASARDHQRGEQAGFYRYLTKPVRVDEIEDALLSLLASKETIQLRQSP